MYFFSVIIPVYNAEQWLNECLNTVARQSFMDFELVVVNDGSTDNSLSILEEFKQEHSGISIEIITQENKGLGAARNNGVKTSNGKWLVFLDADDYWAFNKLEVLYKEIQNGKFTWLYHGIYERYVNGSMRIRNIWHVESLEQFLRIGNPITPSATAIKKSVFVAYGMFDEQRDRVEDLGLWIRLIKNEELHMCLYENMTVYRLGSGLTTNAKEHHQKVLKVVEEELVDQVPQEWIEAFKKRKEYEFSRQLHKNGNFKEALKLYPNMGIKTLVLKLLAQFCIKA